MNKRAIHRPGRIFLKTLIVHATLLCCATSLFAQQSQEEESDQQPFGQMSPPPNFVPPPPPNFSPPSGPPSGIPRPVARPVARPVNTPPAEEELLQRSSDLVDSGDPMMQETVGLIRIPEMGTNEVLEMLENFTAKPILRQQTLPSVKITFFSQNPLTRGEAITAIESLLALNGIAITTLGEKFLKAVPSAIINAQVPRPWEGSTLDATPSQMIYEKLFELDFLSTEEAATLLQPLMSQGAPIAFAKSNLILVTDALINLQRIERLLPVLDQPGKLRTEMLFFELQNLDAEEVVRRLEQLVTGALKNRLENNTTFDADERTNQIIVFTHKSNVELISRLIGKLDIDVAPNTDTNVYSIRYADAVEVVNIIEQVVTGQRQVRTETGADNNPAAQAARARAAAQVRQNNQAAAAARADASNLQFSDYLTIVPDERANTIVASGTHNDLRYLEQLIEQIDTLLAQVRIEVVITEVGLSDEDERGIDNFGIGFEAPDQSSIDFSDPDGQWTLNPGGLYGLTFPTFSWGGITGTSIEMVLTAAQTNSNISVLSAPTIVTTHNKEATVSVGEERPVVTGTTTFTTSEGVQEQVQYRDIKLELKVKPLIGSDGVVQMEIEQQIQSVIGEVSIGTGDNQRDQPIIGTRSANSYVSVGDGDLIALGGLQSLEDRESGGRMAILGRIPIIGDLFTSKGTTYIKTEILIFIRPTIIRTAADADRDANQLIDQIEGTEKIRGYLENGTFRKEEEAPATEERKVPRRNQP
ncbi:MAG: secretin N-terminal domain-containing protein [Puniceicoccaceae bacterium]